MAKRFKASVIGGSGYGGAEIIRRLLMHPEVELARVASIDLVGDPVSKAHPNLEGRTELRFEDLSAKEAADGMDVVLLGLPHKVSALKVPEILETGARIIDLSGDFRIRDVAAYEKYYQTKHPCPDRIESFVYGLPELNREKMKKARYIASPGCFATTIELGLLPLAKNGWLKGNVSTTGITGSSGSGVKPLLGTHHPIRAVNLKTYKTLMHQHTPEILETLNAAGAQELELSFIPVSAPLSRGLFATSVCQVDSAVSPDEIHRAYAECYANERFVRVPEGRLPEVASVSGSNYAEVGVVIGEVHGNQRSIVAVSALDNLIKGGAGQGVQSMNVILGLDEALSLEDPGSWP